MKSGSARLAIWFTGAALCVFASPALAQSTADTSLTEDGYSRLEEVVVTATRRAEKLQDIPIAVTALNERALEDAGISSTMQIARQTPGLVMTQSAAAMQAHIRGVGSLDGAVGQEPSVATFVDGVYVSTAIGAIFALSNIERIEVLKGPQGTLFGRNATGGAIQVVTKTPSHDASGQASISYGNFDTTGAKFYGTAGLSENLAGDLALYYHHQGRAFGRNIVTGAGQDRRVERAIRGKLLFTPTDETTVTLSGGVMKIQTHGTGNGRQLYPGALALTGQALYTGGFYDVSGNVSADTIIDNKDVTFEVLHEANNFTLKSISAFRDHASIQYTDFDFSPASILDLYIDRGSIQTFTQEFQVLSGPSSRMDWILGAFYMHDETALKGPLGLGIFGIGSGRPPPGGIGSQHSVNTESYAGFGEMKWPLFGDATHLTAGVRYTRDVRRLEGFTGIFSDPINHVLLGSINTPPQHAAYNKLTYRAILDHKLAPGVMLYASYSRGFKSGNFNLTSPTAPPYGPEVVDAYEAGAKTDFLDGRVRLNANIYHYDYKGIQLPVRRLTSNVTINAAAAEINGVEITGSVLPVDRLVIDFGVNYMDATVKSFPSAPCFVGVEQGLDARCGVVPVTECVLSAASATVRTYACTLDGNRVPHAPELSINLVPAYTFYTGVGEFRISAGISYTSMFFWEFQNTRKQEAYTLVNAQVGWTAPDGRIGVRVFGDNLSNEKYVLGAQSGVQGDAFASAPPRTYGVELRYSF